MRNLVTLSTNYILLHNSLLSTNITNDTVLSTEPFYIHYTCGAVTVSSNSIYSHITTSYSLLKRSL